MNKILRFANETPLTPVSHESWKLLIVDDDKSIHSVTRLALKSLIYKNKNISFTSSYSAEDAISKLKKESDFAIVLLDIGMEEKDSGLDVASFIRTQLNDHITRIIIRTGQPGDVPEREIISDYDINDYKSKTELTAGRLYTSIRTALAQYEQINALEEMNHQLEERVQKALKIQMKQQEALLLQNRTVQMSELLNMIAHQWRQPLSLISAVGAQVQLSLALDEIDKDELIKKVENIQDYTIELSKTIDEFRSVYEPREQNDTISLYQLLHKCSTIISTSFKNQNIDISIECDRNCRKHICSIEVYQVVLNILKNAQEAFLKFPKQKPYIKIRAKEDKENTYISFEDNAGGINEEISEKIFDPYFSTKEEKNGHGLGLFMSKNIIEQHCNGQLNFTTDKETTTFTIILPNK